MLSRLAQISYLWIGLARFSLVRETLCNQPNLSIILIHAQPNQSGSELKGHHLELNHPIIIAMSLLSVFSVIRLFMS